MTDDLATPSGAQPYFDLAFEVHLRLTAPHVVRCSQLGRERAGVFVTQGHFEGPLLRGTVLGASGGDYAGLRPDGVLEFDARYMLQVDDGTLVYLQSHGYRWSSPEVAARLMRGDTVEAAQYYMRLSARFEVEAGPHDWLARHVFVGVGARTAEGNVIRYFQVL